MKNVLVTCLVAALAIVGGDQLRGQIVVEFDSPTVTVGCPVKLTAFISSLSGSEVLTAYNLPVDINDDGFGMPTGLSILSIDSENGDFAKFNSSEPTGAPFNFDFTASDSDAKGVELSSTPFALFSVTIGISESFPITTLDVTFQESPTPIVGLFAITLDGTTFNEADMAIAGTITTRPLILGDVNLDGIANLLDVDPFLLVLASGEYQKEADANQDGAVNLLDVDPFILIIAGS